MYFVHIIRHLYSVHYTLCFFWHAVVVDSARLI